jgi:hypothetical protein
LKQWLELWLRRVSAEGVPTEPADQIRELATACFELQISAGTSTEQTPPAEADAISLISLFGPTLILKRCAVACSEWHYAECLREILAVYRPQAAAGTAAHEVFRALEAGDSAAAMAALRAADDGGLFLLVLPELAFLVPKAAVAMCLEQYPALRPWQVQEFSYSIKTFLKYLKRLMETKPKCREDTALVINWFLLMLYDRTPPRDELMSPEDGRPLPRSDKLQWRHFTRLMSVIDQSRGNATVTEALTRACREAGFWPGLLRLHTNRGALQCALDIAIDTDDWDSFERLLTLGHSVSLWQSALERVFANAMVNPAASVGVTRSVELMLARAGPIATTEVISAIPGGSGALTPEAMRSIIRVGRISLVDQPAVVRSLLSTVDSYLWSKRPWVSSPQLRAVADLETSGREGAVKVAALPFLTTPEQQSGGGQQLQQKLVPAFDMTPLQISYEEAGASHWGVAYGSPSSSTCVFCSLPLVMADESAALLLRPGMSASSKSIVSSNIVIFPRCGHAYHQSCLGTDACVQCLKANLTSLTKARF